VSVLCGETAHRGESNLKTVEIVEPIYISELILAALATPETEYKQWYLERIFERLGYEETLEDMTILQGIEYVPGKIPPEVLEKEQDNDK
jgi:hypothetical protein